jgi:putative addiction module component (TIGR02574 family)
MSIAEILKLPATERLEMVEQIWNSIKPSEIEITDAQREELDTRIASDKSGKMQWYSIDEMKDRLGKKIK